MNSTRPLPKPFTECEFNWANNRYENYGAGLFRVKRVARPAGLEPATPGLEGRCSIQLSYGRM